MAASRPGAIVPFKQGYGEIPRPIPQSTMARVLAATVAETITPPTGSRYVIFSYGAGMDVYVNCYATAATPVADITNGTAPALNPSGYEFNTNELPDISVVSATAGIVTAEFYA